MPHFQGLHVVSKDRTPRGDSTGLGPYLALEPRHKSKRRAVRPLDVFDALLVALGAVTVLVIGILIRLVLAGVP